MLKRLFNFQSAPPTEAEAASLILILWCIQSLCSYLAWPVVGYQYGQYLIDILACVAALMFLKVGKGKWVMAILVVSRWGYLEWQAAWFYVHVIEEWRKMPMGLSRWLPELGRMLLEIVRMVSYHALLLRWLLCHYQDESAIEYTVRYPPGFWLAMIAWFSDGLESSLYFISEYGVRGYPINLNSVKDFSGVAPMFVVVGCFFWPRRWAIVLVALAFTVCTVLHVANYKYKYLPALVRLGKGVSSGREWALNVAQFICPFVLVAVHALTMFIIIRMVCRVSNHRQRGLEVISP